jgi:two-component system nitrogen regulation sensor histidine kinase NtrY
MNFKYYPLQIILKLLSIILLCVVALLIFLNYSYIATPIVLLAIATIIFLSLYNKINRVNRDLTHFVLAIKNNDLSQNFKSPSNQSYKELYEAFKQVSEKFILERSDSVDQYYLLQTVVEHIRVALISFKVNGEIDIYNQSARNLFNIAYASNISDLNTFSEELLLTLKNLNPNTKKLLHLNTEKGLFKLAIEITEFKQKNEHYRLASVQNIKSELDQHELDSWQKLIRVLNHEVFNSITPIISLSESSKELVHKNEALSIEDLADLRTSFNTIEKRGKNLLKFVDEFRSLTHIPIPHFENFSIFEMFQNMSDLYKSQFKNKSISSNISVEPISLELSADKTLVEQVLINLIKNAIDAISEIQRPSIELNAILEYNRIVIGVKDNGHGISNDSLDKIFIPFFTTKQSGTGIGLSLSKQIMALHKGDIQVNTSNNGTNFYLIFYF